MKICGRFTVPFQTRHRLPASVDREGGGSESPTQGGGPAVGSAGRDMSG